MKISNLLLFTFITFFLVSSCAVNKRMNTVTSELNTIKEQHRQESAQLNKLDSTADHKLSDRRIDKNIEKQIKMKLRKHRDYLELAQNDAELLDSVLESKKTFRKNYKELVLPMLDSLKKKGDHDWHLRFKMWEFTIRCKFYL